MCNVKFKKIETNIKEDIEKDESEIEYHNFYISAYDFGNIKKIREIFKQNNRIR